MRGKNQFRGWGLMAGRAELLDLSVAWHGAHCGASNQSTESPRVESLFILSYFRTLTRTVQADSLILNRKLVIHQKVRNLLIEAVFAGMYLLLILQAEAVRHL
jgi:hypothetical protein